MWVRSQDKTRLIKAKYVRVNGSDVEVLWGNMICTLVGRYSTEEKASKVLDMIQEHIKSMFVGTGMFMGYPFQMPQDSEVEE